ncbi:MAG: ATP-binding protein [Sphaerotilus natans subsp. sulfidivorans]|uniref:ATP-binding protein n=1 Tax=Sphaerotilus sulfidivorans TaxID=639200 RepID=UPI0023552D58|nr:ATP-binding protein [Sphaerotilus sulfidivorans]MCK6404365.1 ATP-binding protein [Sphaerotilus sulfidivorans]
MTTPELPRLKLPLGIQNLREIREGGHYYVDKSGMAVDLIEAGKYYFLSRPRRFGKSLLVDTRWDWSTRHPVIRISFSSGSGPKGHLLAQRIRENLRVNRVALDLPLPAELPEEDLAGNFADLIRQAHQSRGERAVVLVDEYDKPMLDHLTDPAVAQTQRDMLSELYGTLKDCDEHLRFVFLTGVSKFSKVSLFSGLNNLTDITLDARWSALCGYTDEDIDTVFAPELPGLDRDEIRRWYNGYNWLGTGVYNPYDVLNLFWKRSFSSYWFETGTPSFLVKLLAERQIFSPDLTRMQSDFSLLSSFDVDLIEPEALLFQAGYLTIQSATPATPWEEPIYTLGYPNYEVEMALNRALLPAYGVPARQIATTALKIRQSLREADWIGLEGQVRSLFASIPSDWYRSNPLAGFEGHYASVFYSHFAALGLDVRVEDATSHGRIDMAVLYAGRVFLFEFKVVDRQASGAALQQIKDRGYADKYRARGEPIHLVGIEFQRAERNVVGFEVETVAAT